ncbi:hypothetical protein PACTADRAFT_49758 [Pachysolen tannophilus NRRL Y-2460]|uniref:peptidylprolyl isomerase n=1 Tax=Pachysolen tannophilus NRRL Y-2460 TaxID=669874 RepID=A0A1E4TXB6_PACTA|nr:hypothetical protein PACTADRAFT_49758 [Pachysolen tannophilus NRRL Y-2460]
MSETENVSKRLRDSENVSSSEDNDDDGNMFGPNLTNFSESAIVNDNNTQESSVERILKKPKLKPSLIPINEKELIKNLTFNDQYGVSYMHKSQITFICTSPYNDSLVVTCSKDGFIKFWARKENNDQNDVGDDNDDQDLNNVEFIKQYLAHKGSILKISINPSFTDKLMASISENDTTVKIFDMTSIDMINIVELAFQPINICWGYYKNELRLIVISGEEKGNKIHIIDPNENKVLITNSNIHKSRIEVLEYNLKYECLISIDNEGMIEYWQPGGNLLKPDSVFKLKSKTNLYDLKKFKLKCYQLNFSQNFNNFVIRTFPDNKIRIFEFSSGKELISIDDSIESNIEFNQLLDESIKLNEFDLNKKIQIEQKNFYNDELFHMLNVIFDKSGNFILFSSILGIKCINLITNKCISIIGLREDLRFLQVSLSSPTKKAPSPLLFTNAANRPRFYIFSDSKSDPNTRDIFNENPKFLNNSTEANIPIKYQGSNVILHTNYGDIKIKLFPKYAPLAVENFVNLCFKNYYNNVIFHRIIKNFMIQTGDPTGTGMGGESIWKHPFKDEFSRRLKHRNFIVSMANNGPDSNGSQFFIVTQNNQEELEQLNDKHTIFGQVVSGFDVVKTIENLHTDNSDRPTDVPIPKIISTTVD